MSFLFGPPKLSSKELNECLEWVGLRYKLTELQERAAEAYNNALVKHVNSMSTDKSAAQEVTRVARQMAQTNSDVVFQYNRIKSVPDAASKANHVWGLTFKALSDWSEAQCTAIEAVADGNQPHTDYVRGLLQYSDKLRKQAEDEEKKLVKRMQKSGATIEDFRKLTAAASRAADVH